MSSSVIVGANVKAGAGAGAPRRLPVAAELVVEGAEEEFWRVTLVGAEADPVLDSAGLEAVVVDRVISLPGAADTDADLVCPAANAPDRRRVNGAAPVAAVPRLGAATFLTAALTLAAFVAADAVRGPSVGRTVAKDEFSADMVRDGARECVALLEAVLVTLPALAAIFRRPAVMGGGAEAFFVVDTVVMVDLVVFVLDGTGRPRDGPAPDEDEAVAAVGLEERDAVLTFEVVAVATGAAEDGVTTTGAFFSGRSYRFLEPMNVVRSHSAFERSNTELS